mmetsp:Transcript_40748/g.73213  ORF Transcript_40748/g.73213 Transcript_40748/m.73213 type:complete len:264 (+) Transcript_40748:1259-2050(+)
MQRSGQLPPKAPGPHEVTREQAQRGGLLHVVGSGADVDVEARVNLPLAAAPVPLQHFDAVARERVQHSAAQRLAPHRQLLLQHAHRLSVQRGAVRVRHAVVHHLLVHAVVKLPLRAGSAAVVDAVVARARALLHQAEVLKQEELLVEFLVAGRHPLRQQRRQQHLPKLHPQHARAAQHHAGPRRQAVHLRLDEAVKRGRQLVLQRLRCVAARPARVSKPRTQLVDVQRHAVALAGDVGCQAVVHRPQHSGRHSHHIGVPKRLQ